MRLTYLTGVVLAAIEAGHRYGFDIMDATGIPDGTVYPALRRLEGGGFLEARWEDHQEAADLNRPARRYYRLTADGRALLAQALERFPGVGRIFVDPEPEGSR